MIAMCHVYKFGRRGWEHAWKKAKEEKKRKEVKEEPSSKEDLEMKLEKEMSKEAPSRRIRTKSPGSLSPTLGFRVGRGNWVRVSWLLIIILIQISIPYIPILNTFQPYP